MSKYTTEVRFLCESLTGHDESVGYNSVNDILEDAAPIIFGFNYPIFDEAYRLPLEIKILRHYYTREISEETYGLWKMRLEDRMNVIMPYYNQLYRSTLLEFNPLYDVDLQTTHEGSKNGVVNGDSINKTKRDTEESNENEDNIDEIKSKSGDNYSNKNITGSKENNENSYDNSIKTGDNDRVKNDRGNIGDLHTGTVDDEGNASRVVVNNENGIDTNSETTVGNRNIEYSGNNVDTNSSESKSSGSENGSNDSWSLFSDTPQGGINGMIAPNSSGPSGLENNIYLTTAKHDYGTSENESENKEINDSISTGNESSLSKDSNNVTVNGNAHNVRESVESGDENDKRRKTFNENNTKTLNTDETEHGSFVENNIGTAGKSGNESQSENEKIDNNYSEIESNNAGKRSKGRLIGNESINNVKTNSTVSTNTDEYLQHVSGKSGGVSYSYLLMEYRNSFINIDEMIIEELSDLFFGLW